MIVLFYELGNEEYILITSNIQHTFFKKFLIFHLQSVHLLD